MNEIFSFIFLPFVLSKACFILIMHWLKNINFDARNKRKDDWRKLEPELLTQQIEYHNKATYNAFELYIKLLLGILGGIAFVVISKVDKPHSKTLIQTGGYSIIPVTILFCVLIFVHQKSKIERWKKGYKWYEPLMWNECWFTSISITVMIITNYILIPKLIV
jgi:hypothetical protein